MKYLTPQRYLAFYTEDEQSFLNAHQQWEDALAAYGSQLDRIKSALPTKFRKLIETVYLHDAAVLSAHQHGDTFVMTLAPYTDPGHLVVLLYSLVGDAAIETDQLPPERRREGCIQWLYDELDLARPEGPLGVPIANEKPTFRHNILLSNGWEIDLRFRSVGVVRPLRVLPVPPQKLAVVS